VNMVWYDFLDWLFVLCELIHITIHFGLVILSVIFAFP